MFEDTSANVNNVKFHPIPLAVIPRIDSLLMSFPHRVNLFTLRSLTPMDEGSKG
jgi:hypothetical protein